MKTVRIRNKNIYVKDIVIAIIIAVLPFLFYIYKLAPETRTWDLGFIVVDSVKFDDVSIFLWILFTKGLIFLSLTIWFVTCKHWWRFAILIPLIIETFKIFTLFNSNEMGIDELEFFRSLPLTIPIIFLVYLLSKKLNYFSQSIDLIGELNYEIEKIFSEMTLIIKIDISSYRQEFEELKNNKDRLNDDVYLKKLIEFRLKFVEDSTKNVSKLN